jgi:hypothetical protein
VLDKFQNEFWSLIDQIPYGDRCHKLK